MCLCNGYFVSNLSGKTNCILGVEKQSAASVLLYRGNLTGNLKVSNLRVKLILDNL